MKYSATLIALAAAVMAVPNEKRSVDPLSASLAVYSVLPSSLQAEALTNPAAAASEISAEFASSATPTWFSKLSPDVQSYFLAQGAATTTAGPIATGVSGGNTTSIGPYSNTTITTSSGAATTAAATTLLAAGTTTGTSTSSSTGGASMPTQVVGAGLAGAIGLIGMLVL